MKEATALTETVSGNPILKASRRQWLNENWPGLDVNLIPHCLQPICNRSDISDLLPLLTNNCCAQPSSVNIHVEKVPPTSSIEDLIKIELSGQSTLDLPTDRTAYITVVNHLLRRVIVLRLHCDQDEDIRDMIGMIEIVTADGQDCQLKHPAPYHINFMY